MIKKILFTLLGLLILLLVLLFGGVFFFLTTQEERIFEKVSQFLEKETGQALYMEEAFSLTIFPHIKIIATNGAWGKDSSLDIAFDRMEVQVSLWSILRGKLKIIYVDVDGLKLVYNAPIIHGIHGMSMVPVIHGVPVTPAAFNFMPAGTISVASRSGMPAGTISFAPMPNTSSVAVMPINTTSVSQSLSRLVTLQIIEEKLREIQLPQNFMKEVFDVIPKNIAISNADITYIQGDEVFRFHQVDMDVRNSYFNSLIFSFAGLASHHSGSSTGISFKAELDGSMQSHSDEFSLNIKEFNFQALEGLLFNQPNQLNSSNPSIIASLDLDYMLIEQVFNINTFEVSFFDSSIKVSGKLDHFNFSANLNFDVQGNLPEIFSNFGLEAPSTLPNEIAIQTQVILAKNILSLSNINAEIDGATLTGGLDFGLVNLDIDGELDFADFDLTAYMGADFVVSTSITSSTGVMGTTAKSVTSVKSALDLPSSTLFGSDKKSIGATLSNSLSLSQMWPNVSLNLSATNTKIDTLYIPSLEGKIVGKSGIYRIDPFKMEIFDGLVSAKMLANLTSSDVRVARAGFVNSAEHTNSADYVKTPSVKAQISMDSFDMNMLLLQFGIEPILQGKASMNMDMIFSIKNPLESMIGKGIVHANNLLLDVQLIPESAPVSIKKSASTKFETVQIPFAMEKNILLLNDVQMTSPDFVLHGDGLLNLVTDALEMNGTLQISALKVTLPVSLVGTIQSPKYIFDTRNIIKAIQDIARQHISGNSWY